MCGRITQRSGELPGLVTIMSDGRDSRIKTPPRYNGAPGQEHWVIRQNPETGERTRDLLWWGLIPYWVKDAGGGRRPINAKAETVATLPTFRDAYRRRRCLLPIDNFFEWKAIRGAKTKQPYAIAMQSGEPFALAAIWENWKRPGTEEWVRTFCVITCPANELVADIHDRMPVIIPPESYDHWLSTLDPDHGRLTKPHTPQRTFGQRALYRAEKTTQKGVPEAGAMADGVGLVSLRMRPPRANGLAA